MKLKDTVTGLVKFGLKAYISIVSDDHLSEFINNADNDVLTLTGFSGTNGKAITLERDGASALYTDARYYERAEKEAPEYRLMKIGKDISIAQFILEAVKEGDVGFDLKKWSSKEFDKLKKDINNFNIGINLIQAPEDFISSIRENISEKKHGQVINLEQKKMGDFIKSDWAKSHDIKSEILEKNVTGSSYKEKLEKIRKILGDKDILITDLNTIAWIFNLRGNDIKNQTFFYSFAYITKESAILFTDADNVDLNGVEVRSYDDIYEFIDDLSEKTNTLNISGDTNAYISNKFKNKEYIDDIENLKNIKTESEIVGALYANILDAVELTRLFAWIDKKAYIGSVTELEVSDKLLQLKRKNSVFDSVSFDSIVGVDKNSSIIHHSVGNDKISSNSIVLLDTGSHYFFGSTDISRTLGFGRPTDEMKKLYTNVLKGVISAKLLRKSELTAEMVDEAARNVLKTIKMDYPTATGHGVGNYLSIHQNPLISSDTKQKIEPNTIFTIEPGAYKKGEYGFRIEDMVYYSKNSEILNLTYVPLCLDLIDASIMSHEEIDYLNKYSKKVYEELKPFFKDDDEVMLYLSKNTLEINPPNPNTKKKSK